jgi:nucleoside phosphorylase
LTKGISSGNLSDDRPSPDLANYYEMEGMVDLLIITALTEEHQVVTAVMKLVASEMAVQGHLRIYQLPLGEDRSCRVVTASAHAIGAVSMAVFATSLFERFQPESATLVGIAAAIDSSVVDLGDVPFASQVISYDDIVTKDGALTFRTEGFQVDPVMRRVVGELRTSTETYQPWRDDCIRAIRKIVYMLNPLRRTTIRPPEEVQPPHLVVEVTAGGPFLLRDADFRDALVKRSDVLPEGSIRVEGPVHPKLVSAEMESHGFMQAAHAMRVPATVFKGISDAGDRRKAELESKTGGFFRAYACSNAVLAALHALRIKLLIALPSSDGVSPPKSSQFVKDSPPGEERAIEVGETRNGPTSPHERGVTRPSGSSLLTMRFKRGERWALPEWLAFHAPNFDSLVEPTIPEETVRVVRVKDASGAPSALTLRLRNRLSLLVFDGPQLSGKTWYAREVISELTAHTLEASLVLYVLVPCQRLDSRPPDLPPFGDVRLSPA